MQREKPSPPERNKQRPGGDKPYLAECAGRLKSREKQRREKDPVESEYQGRRAGIPDNYRRRRNKNYRN